MMWRQIFTGGRYWRRLLLCYFIQMAAWITWLADMKHMPIFVSFVFGIGTYALAATILDIMGIVFKKNEL